MTNNWVRWLVLAVALVAAGWLWQASDDTVQVLAALALALMAVVANVRQYYVQAARRWRRALDAYVERVLAGESRGKSAIDSAGKVSAPIGCGQCWSFRAY